LASAASATATIISVHRWRVTAANASSVKANASESESPSISDAIIPGVRATTSGSHVGARGRARNDAALRATDSSPMARNAVISARPPWGASIHPSSGYRIRRYR
jgi:hypothetical protein